MRYLFTNIIVALCAVGLTGCGNFLEESSQDEVRPSTVADLNQLMIGEVYPAGSSFLKYLDVMTDDVESEYTSYRLAEVVYNNAYSIFTWRSDMFEVLKERSVAETDTYEHYYRRIMGCNVILELIDAVRGEEAERENVRGQALAMRAYYYFMLVNCFGKPYNADGVDPEKAPGVPLVLKSKVTDDYPSRASVAAVYRQVEKDLLEALPLMEQYGQNNSKYKVSDMFVHTLLSRMYLYMENWGEAEKYATKGLEKNPSLLRLSTIAYLSIWYASSYPERGVYDMDSPEAIWLGYTDYREYEYLGGYPKYALPFRTSYALQGLYEFDEFNSFNRKDLRCRYFYMYDWVNDVDYDVRMLYGSKASYKSAAGSPIKGMRVAELYLNRAEALIHQFLKSGEDGLRIRALDDLNHLREYRYDTRNVAYVPVSITDGAELLRFYRDERRRELSFEDHRWFDLRRYGMPELKHTFRMHENETATVYVLPQGGDRYVLPIPKSVLEKNPNLEPNP